MDSLKTFKIFVSCPGDMNEERDKVKQYISEYNTSVARKSNILFETVDFSDVPSTFGLTPQEIINNYILSYDGYLGLMGARFGSPTANLESGTQEEFQRAMSKRLEMDLHVSFLFKRVTTPIGTLDKKQRDEYDSVDKFRESISSTGVYKNYSDDARLQIELDLILDEIVSKISNDKKLEILAHHPSSSVNRNAQPKIKIKFFSTFLNSLGSSLSNGSKDLLLDDVYTPLDLAIIKPTDQQDETVEDKYFSSENLYPLLNAEKANVVILGDDSAGKTTVLKRLFLDLYANDFFPVYVRGRDLKYLKIEDFDKVLNAVILEQYDNFTLKKLSPEWRNKLVLLLDDFDHIKLNEKFKPVFLKDLAENFPRLVLTCDDFFLLNTQLNNKEHTISLSDFQMFKIRDMGQVLRDKLIQRWHIAGREETIEDAELFSLTESDRNTVNTILGTNYVPRKPLIILVLLQAIGTGKGQKLAHTGFVHYYRYLIDTMLLSKVASGRSELYYAFMPEIANKLFLAPNRQISEHDFDTLITDFCTRRALGRFDIIDVKNTLINLNVLELKQHGYAFKQGYVYYYFFSQYLSDNLENEKTAQTVTNICENLHLRENANIIVFLCHHTRSRAIRETILKISDNLFAETAQFRFDGMDIEGINSLIKEMPTVIASENAKVDREAALETQERDENSDRQPVSLEQIIDPTELTSQLNMAMRSVEIIGQIMKNHYASFDGEIKKKLYLSAANVAFRSLAIVMKNLTEEDENLASFVTYMQPNIKDEHLKKMVFMILNMIIFNFIKITSRHTGSKDLRFTYDEVKNDQLDDLTYQILDFSIRLDSFDEFPFSELSDLAQKCGKNFVAMTILRSLVNHRLYMRPLSNHAEHQRICSAVGITPRKALLIESKSAEAPKRVVLKPVLTPAEV